MTDEEKLDVLLREVEVGLPGVTEGPWKALGGREDGDAYLEPVCFGYEGEMSGFDAHHLARQSPDNWRTILAGVAAVKAERDALRAERTKLQEEQSELVAIAILQGRKSAQDEARALNASVRQEALEEAAKIADATVEYSGSRCVEDVLQEGAANARAESIADAIRSLTAPEGKERDHGN